MDTRDNYFETRIRAARAQINQRESPSCCLSFGRAGAGLPAQRETMESWNLSAWRRLPGSPNPIPTHPHHAQWPYPHVPQMLGDPRAQSQWGRCPTPQISCFIRASQFHQQPRMRRSNGWLCVLHLAMCTGVPLVWHYGHIRRC